MFIFKFFFLSFVHFVSTVVFHQCLFIELLTRENFPLLKYILNVAADENCVILLQFARFKHLREGCSYDRHAGWKEWLQFTKFHSCEMLLTVKTSSDKFFTSCLAVLMELHMPHSRRPPWFHAATLCSSLRCLDKNSSRVGKHSLLLLAGTKTIPDTTFHYVWTI